jgi:haloacid dehalogenase-like hydrolase
MNGKPLKHYLFASDFDQTLTFNDSGYVLSELVGIPTEEFERKSKGMAKLNLVQQGAELAYLLLHDPEFQSRVRKKHLYEVGKRIRLKENIELLYRILENGIEGYHFDFYVLSAAPVEVIHSALEGIVPPDHIYGTEFRYDSDGAVESITRATAGYGKVAVLDALQNELQTASPSQFLRPNTFRRWRNERSSARTPWPSSLRFLKPFWVGNGRASGSFSSLMGS